MRQIVLIYFFYVMGCFMKKILSIFFSISILSVAFFGSCLSVSASGDTDFYKYLQVGEVSEHDKGIYDSVYGSDGWYTDSDGYLWIDKSNNAYNSNASKLMLSIVPRAGVLGNYESIYNGLRRFYNANKLFDWVNDHKGDMNLKNGILSIGKNAISAWGDVFRNNCTDAGSYKLITNNVSNAELISEITASYSGYSADIVQKYVFDSYNRYFLSDRPDKSRSFVFNYFDKMISSFDCFAVWDSYSSSSSLKLYNSSTFSNDDLSRIYYLNSEGSLYSDTDFYVYPGKYSYRYHGSPLKIFSSLTSAKYYYGILNSDDTVNVYYYNNYSPTNINVNLSTVKNTNYEQVFNNTYNTINEEKNTYITNNSSISEEELQKIIEKALEKYISDTGNSGGSSGGDSGSSSGGSSGGDSGGSSGGTITDLSGIEKLLKSIEHFLDLIEQHTGWTDTRLELTNSVLSNMQTVINTIGDTLTGQQDILKEIRDLLDADSGKSIFDHLGDILDNTIGELLGNILKDLVDFFIGDGGIVEAVTSPASALASTAQSKFPTSIPWDIIAIIRIMSAEPEPPKIAVPFKIDRLGIDYTIKIDLSKADKVAELSRNMLTVTFLLFLTIQTRKLYGAMSKN